MWIAGPFASVTLEGAHVRLEPLSLERHFDDLRAVALDPELWRWTGSQVRDEEDLRRYLESAVRDRERGLAVPFATVATAAGRAVGSTRFASLEPRHRRVEIGWTWIGRPWQRTAVNTEAKLLMMRHAFEVWRCLRVELKTDVLNERSRAAIRRLGAREEGILRSHMVTAAGRVRDTVYYSVIEREWPAVRAALEARLARGA